MYCKKVCVFAYVKIFCYICNTGAHTVPRGILLKNLKIYGYVERENER